MNFLKNLFGTNDDNEGFVDDEYDGYDTSSSAVTEEEGYSSSYSAQPTYASSAPTPKAINIHNGFGNQPKITVMKPKNYEEVMTDAILRLREGTIIFLNLEDVDSVNGSRIVDFMTGAIAMCDGRIKKVDTCSYAVAPKNVEWVNIIDD